jgi:hypothetical protein
MLTEQDRARIVEHEMKAFLSEGFGQLDLSGSPSLQPLPNDKFEVSDSKGFNNVAVSGSNLLKALADNPDPETIEQIARETGDPDLAEKIRQDKEGEIAEEFVRTHPTYYRSDFNYAAIRHFLDERRLPFTAENVHTAVTTLTRMGLLETNPGVAKRLTEAELLLVISLAKNGQITDALNHYLTCCFPDAGDEWNDETEFFADSRTLNARNAAARLIWFNTRPVQDTSEFRTFEQQYFKLRPVRTVSDYDDAWNVFQVQERSITRDRMIRGTEAPVTPEALDELDDSQLNQLTAQTLRQRARQLSRARRRN